MRIQDMSQILKGLTLVIDQVIVRKQPDIESKLIQIRYHVNEIFKVIIDTKSFKNQNDNNHNNVENVDNVKSEIMEEIDPTGFSKIRSLYPNNEFEHANVVAQTQETKKQMRERSVPSTQFGRVVGFGGLAIRMAMGEVVDRASNVMNGNTGPRVISNDNAERLAEALCRMRGAALKLGQMLSLQDESSLPPSLAKALERVKQAADYMPKYQLEQQLNQQFGIDWKSKLLEFDPVPIAAASIGQVHRAKLLDGTDVAMKIQYPGVAESIDSDLMNLKRVVQMTNLLPPGLFVDNIIQVASVELKAECDYKNEMQSQIKYRELIMNDKVLSKHCYVPKVYSELCTSKILTTELVPGLPIDSAINYPQEIRNAIARTVLIVTIRELFEWRFIQSDPNYANFLYDPNTHQINMIDFGAARKYDKSFVDGYMKLVWAAANKDNEMILNVSKELGFLTGDETKEFKDVHLSAGLIVGEPFLNNKPFDFGNSKLTIRLSSYGSSFVKYRLTPPPTEAYSLHRKLGGAFLLCIKLKANISCRDILEKTYNEYIFL